jgi:TetR/AcrR family fatty acid metabolism transcriptional regulator
MAYRRTPATAARKDARHKAILDAATRMFGSYGYHSATVPMIVAEAGSSVGSFYAHFRNKEDVFAAVLEALGRQVTELMDQARVSQSDPLLGLSYAVEVLFLFLAENPGEARILIVESSGLSPRLEKVRRDLLRQHASLVRQALESAPEASSLVNPAIAARCLVGAVFESLCSWLEESPADRPSAAEVARAVADYNSRAIRS